MTLPQYMVVSGNRPERPQIGRGRQVKCEEKAAIADSPLLRIVGGRLLAQGIGNLLVEAIEDQENLNPPHL